LRETGQRKAPRRPWLADRGGATAAEFALTLAATITLTLGVINLAIVIYSYAALQAAAQTTARWAAIQAMTGSPADAAAIEAHGRSVLRGAGEGARFASEAALCGTEVRATTSLPLLTGIATFQIPLAVRACAAGG